MEKVWQEFYCHMCQVYIMVKLNMAINRRVAVVCPGCQRHHERTVVKGEIRDNGKTGRYDEEICPPKSATSKTPRHRAMNTGVRGGAIIKTDADIVGDNFLRDRWLELYEGKK